MTRRGRPIGRAGGGGFLRRSGRGACGGDRRRPAPDVLQEGGSGDVAAVEPRVPGEQQFFGRPSEGHVRQTPGLPALVLGQILAQEAVVGLSGFDLALVVGRTEGGQVGGIPAQGEGEDPRVAHPRAQSGLPGRELAFDEFGDRDEVAPFQALRRVDRHDLDDARMDVDVVDRELVDAGLPLPAVFVAVDHVEPGGELRQAASRMLILVVASERDEGVDGGLDPLRAGRGDLQPQDRDAVRYELVERQVHAGAQALQDRGDGGQAFAGWNGEAAPLGQIGEGFDQAGLAPGIEPGPLRLFPGELDGPGVEGAQIRGADPPQRQQAQEQVVAGGVDGYAQGRAHREDLGAHDQALPSDDLVGHAQLAQGLGHRVHVGAFPAQHGYLRLSAFRGRLGCHLPDPARDGPVGVVARFCADFGDAPRSGPGPSGQPLHLDPFGFQAGRHCVGGVEDRPVGAERRGQGQLRRPSQARAETAGEVGQGVGAGPAPPVDGLVGVPHRAHGPARHALGRQRRGEELRLADGGVLVFVEEDEPVSGGDVASDGGVGPHEGCGRRDLVGEFDDPLASLALEVGFDDGQAGDLEGEGGVLDLRPVA